MRPQNTLGVLSLLLTKGAYATTPAYTQELDCSLQAWVRAPDLVPGRIIQGDARLKLSAGCPAIETASLGLRFKERSFTKASRSLEAPKRQAKDMVTFDIFDPEFASPASPWVHPLNNAVNCSADIAFETIVKNKDLWLLREQERVVFESTQAIDVGQVESGAVRDVQVHDFAILVPSTNFPPALDYVHSRVALREQGEFVNVESIYEYFVRVAFMNGTTVELPAGFTAFHPLYYPPNDKVQSKMARLQTIESLDGNIVDCDPVANYTVEIITEQNGIVFFQGSKELVTVIITRTGRARSFVQPLKLHSCIDSRMSPNWSYKFTSDRTLQPLHKPNQKLRATPADFVTPTASKSSRCISLDQGTTLNPKQVTMPNATQDQIAAGEIVRTTSDPIDFFLDVDPRHTTDFETYYYSLTNALQFSLEVPRAQDEPPRPGDIFEMREMKQKTPRFEADEETWVPWYDVPETPRWRTPRTYTGDVPVLVYPTSRMEYPTRPVPVATDTESQTGDAHPEDGHDGVEARRAAEGACADCVSLSPVHYAHPDPRPPRGPVFVDGCASNVEALREKTPAERDALAPVLKPVTSSPPEGAERVHRYYRVPEGHRPLIYVGETWVKKVTHKDQLAIAPPRPDTMSMFSEMVATIKHMVDEL